MKPSLKTALAQTAFCGLLLTAGSARADYSNVVASYNPLAYWRLNETTAAPAPVKVICDNVYLSTEKALNIGPLLETGDMELAFFDSTELGLGNFVDWHNRFL